MNGPFGDDVQVQLIAVDHEGLFETVLWAYMKVATKGADRAILHRAALAPGYRADPDEVNRLRAAQRRLKDLDVPGRDAMIDDLERQIALEHGDDRSASNLARLDLPEVRDAAIRWSVIGKRGAPVRVSSELIGVLQALFPDDIGEDGFPGILEGSATPEDHVGDLVFEVPQSAPTERHTYRPPAEVLELSSSLDGIDRPTLDEAINGVIGTGPSAEETATWLENDFEALTNLYRRAAAKRAGLWFRYL
ncbi:MAG: hypothetical protein KDA24_09730 [Deltaproteobacteria bacterium]|nr:hypothetical protein [Deltaproteobacteria bacterium]